MSAAYVDNFIKKCDTELSKWILVSEEVKGYKLSPVGIYNAEYISTHSE